MKNLKKSSFLFLILLFCLSCSNDDNNKPSVNFEEKIIGKWNLVDRVPNGIEYCELTNYVQFSQDGDFHLQISIGDEPSACQTASSNGTWLYLGNDQVEIDLSGVEENTVLIVDFFDNYTAFDLKTEDSQQYEVYAKQ